MDILRHFYNSDSEELCKAKYPEHGEIDVFQIYGLDFNEKIQLFLRNIIYLF